MRTTKATLALEDASRGYAEAKEMLLDLIGPGRISSTAIRVARDHMMQFIRRDRITVPDARGEIERLRAALKPFADAADDVADEDLDRHHLWESPAAMNISVGNLREARAAMRKESPG